VAKTIAFANRKGGCGKTTLAYNVVSYISKINKRVLAIDFDSQAQMTLYAGLMPHTIEYGIYEMLMYFLNKGRRLQKCMKQVRNMFIIPANQNLASFDTAIVNFEHKEMILRDLLMEIEAEYDYVIIDTPPSLGYSTINALAASDFVVIPVKTDFLSLAGLAQMMKVFYKVNVTLNPLLQLLCVVPTMFDTRTRISHEVLEELKDNFGPSMVSDPIRVDVKIAESASHGLSIFDYKPKSRGAQDIKGLVDFLLEKM